MMLDYSELQLKLSEASFNEIKQEIEAKKAIIFEELEDKDEFLFNSGGVSKELSEDQKFMKIELGVLIFTKVNEVVKVGLI